MKRPYLDEDWEILMRFLPDQWASKAYELGALVRRRKIDSAETLLRVLLIHLVDGKSLRTTAAYAKEANLCSLNDVALLHRLRSSSEWFHWMSMELLKNLNDPLLESRLLKRFRIRVVDGSSVSKPGSVGTDWRIHYCFQLSNLRCDTFKITSSRVGETFERYSIEADDLIVGDRGYCQRKGIMHVLRHKGQVLVRFHSRNLPLFTRRGTPWPVLKSLRTLPEGKVGDWNVWFRDPYDNHLVKGRLCSLRKSQEAIDKTKKKLQRLASRKQHRLLPETLEHAEYVTLFTTVNRHHFKSEEIALLYGGRWQIELVFKRLKSLVKIGELPKYKPESCVAWLYGKMFVALLVERLYREAEFFSPWGFPLYTPRQEDREEKNRRGNKSMERV